LFLFLLSLQEYPRQIRGLDYDVNWSLAGDKITTRGQVFRNAKVRDFLEFMPRNSIQEIQTSNETVSVHYPAIHCAISSTDVLKGCNVVDISEFEEILSDLQRNCLSYSSQLFVEDASVGSSRASELKVRVISDSPIVSLFFRNILHAVPLYSPEIFPKTITMFIGTKSTESPFVGVDVDPKTSQGNIVVRGNVNLLTIRESLLKAASKLMTLGGYRSIPGGNHVPNIKQARQDGVLNWYFDDRHIYDTPSDKHPSILPIQVESVLVNSSGKNEVSTTLVLGSSSGIGKLSTAALAKGKLYTSNAAVWHKDVGISAFWGGVIAPVVGGGASGSQEAAGSKVSVLTNKPRGTLVVQGLEVVATSQAKYVPEPSKVVVIGNEANEEVEAIKKWASPSLSIVKVQSEAEAITASGL
jgi:hypothetical protein